MLLDTLGASLLGHLFPDKAVIQAGDGVISNGDGMKKKVLMPSHPLTNLEIQRYFQNESKFKSF